MKSSEAVSQIDRQIEENVAVSSMENLQLSCPSLVNGGDLIDDYRVAENGIPDLSIISEENSHIPTDMCTSVSAFWIPFAQVMQWDLRSSNF